MYTRPERKRDYVQGYRRYAKRRADEDKYRNHKKMLNDGLLSCEKTAEYTGLSLNEVLALKEN